MRCFSDVISIWPTSADMARDLGVCDVTIRAWRARGIPPRWWLEVVKAARKRGVSITMETLAAMATPPAGGGARQGECFAYVLPIPPSANRMWRRAGPRIHANPEYAAWKQEAAWLCRAQGLARIAGAYRLRIVAPATRKDPDNFVKPINDALQAAGVIADDRHMRALVLDVDEARDVGTVLIEIEAVAEAPKKRTRERKPGRRGSPSSRAAIHHQENP